MAERQKIANQGYRVKVDNKAGRGIRATLASNALYTMPKVKLAVSRCYRLVLGVKLFMKVYELFHAQLLTHATGISVIV